MEEYQTIPGVIILVLRVVVMLCFLVALRDTMMHEFSQVRGYKLRFGALRGTSEPKAADAAQRQSSCLKIKRL